MTDQLREVYRPDAEALCSAVVNTLESAAESYINSPGDYTIVFHICAFDWILIGDTMNSLTFIGRVADELSSSSNFMLTIGCGSSVAEG
jgi:hypothetical protein